MNDTLVFLRNTDQISLLQKNHPEYLKSAHLVSTDIEVSATLDKIGCARDEMSSLINTGESRQLLAESYRLRDAWHRDLPDSIAQQDGYAWSFFFRDGLVARTLFGKVLRKEHRRVAVFDGMRPSVWVSDNDVADAVWRFQAERQSRETVVIRSQEKLYRPPVRRLLRTIKGKFQKRSIPRRAVLFIAAPGSEIRRYRTICHSLERSLGPRFVPLSAEYPPVNEDYGFIPLPAVLPAAPRTKRPAPAGRLWETLAVATEYPELFQNPYLRFQFEHFFNVRWPALRNLRASFKRLLSDVEAECLIVTDIPYANQDIFVEAARELNIPTCSVPHSATPSVAREHLHTTVSIGWTRNYPAILDAQGSTAIKIVAGMPKSLLSETAGDPTKTEKRDRKLITVLSTLTKVGLLPPNDLGAYLETLDLLVNVPSRLRPSVYIIWKCHPQFDHYCVVESLIQKHGVQDYVDLRTSGSLQEYIARADLVAATLPTAACVYPLLLRKPFIFLNTSGYDPENSYLAQHSGPCAVRDAGKIWQNLEGALFDAKIRSTVLEDNGRILDSLVPGQRAISDDEAAAQILRAIEIAKSK